MEGREGGKNRKKKVYGSRKGGYRNETEPETKLSDFAILSFEFTTFTNVSSPRVSSPPQIRPS